MNIVFTRHAIERFNARWKSSYCESIEMVFNKSSEDRSIINSPKILNLYEIYGYDVRYRLFSFKNLVFVGIEQHTTRYGREYSYICIVTVICITEDGSKYSRMVNKIPRYGKPKNFHTSV